jgi:hypothetical protein
MAMPVELQIHFSKLLRLRGMLNAAQIDATPRAGTALVNACNALKSEIVLTFADPGLSALREEFERLFPPVGMPQNTHLDSAMLTAANSALVQLRTMSGWIEGLIDEASFDARLRAEAEAKVRQQAKQPTGFSASVVDSGDA